MVRDAVMDYTNAHGPLEVNASKIACRLLLDRLSECPRAGITDFGDEGRIVLTEEGLIKASEWMSDESSQPLYFVSFIGFLREGDPNKVSSERWKCDEQMCEELLTMSPTVYAYISVSVSKDPLVNPNGDWFNLVFFPDMGFLNEFNTSKFHGHAKEFLSPASFTDVCVRSGSWVGGVRAGKSIVHKSVLITEGHTKRSCFMMEK